MVEVVVLLLMPDDDAVVYVSSIYLKERKMGSGRKKRGRTRPFIYTLDSFFQIPK